MLKDDFWTGSTDTFGYKREAADLVQGNICSAAHILNSDSLEPHVTANQDTVASPQVPGIPQILSTAPIIFEDIWGDDIGESTVTDVLSMNEQIACTHTEPNSEWVGPNEESLNEIIDNETLLRPTETNEIAVPQEEISLLEIEHASDLLAEFERISTSSVFDEELEQGFLLNNIELLDIDAALAELAEKELSIPQLEEKDTGVLIGRGNVSGWMGSLGVTYINWECGEEAEQEALKRLGYAEIAMSEATRAFVLQAARAAKLPRREERELTMQLAQARLLKAQLPKCTDPENDPYAEQRATLTAECRKID